MYIHPKHGSPFWFLDAASDSHKTFALTLKTIPPDDSGVLHMLEHLTLRVSDSFPISGVFKELQKRSYATYLNAVMSPEYTTKLSDFEHCVNVYLDFVFRPQLTAAHFALECHSLELEDCDITRPLRHGGGVYNKMCGAFSGHARWVALRLKRSLCAVSAGRFSSGGVTDETVRTTVDSVRAQWQIF
jgi:Zn-dependent M16 (insulinase) family peptidase